MTKVKKPVKPAVQYTAEEQILLQNDIGKKKVFAYVPRMKIHYTSHMPRTRRDQQTLCQVLCVDRHFDSVLFSQTTMSG